MSDSNGTRRIFQQIPMDSIGFQRIPMDFTGKNMKKSENVGKSRKFMIRLFMIRLWLFPNLDSQDDFAVGGCTIRTLISRPELR